MKSSGIEWIGDIPEDWEVKKLKYVAEVDPTISEFLGDNDIVSFAPMECLGEQTLSPYETEYGKVKGKYTYFANEDIIMAKVTPCFENGNIAIAKNLKNNVGFGSSELFVFRAKNISNSFLMYSLYSEPFKSLAKSTMYGTGGLKRVSPEFILNYKIPFPPLKTQEKIADYLDEKCGEIDATITKQKESIEKLKAYKQSLISETVTKGLDKSASLKPSGIDYLGDIPSYWEIRKLKYVAKLDPTISEFLSDNDIVSFAPMECLGEQTLSPYETEYSKVKGKYTYFANEDIIMAKVTPCFENGNIAIAKNLKNNVGFGSSELFVFRTKSVNNSFLMYSLYSEPFKSLAKSTMYGTGGLKRVSPNFILNYKIPLPPLKTQERIADYLDSKCSQIDKYITEKQNIIQKLDAYKKSLIFECVTGKQKI